MTRTFRSSDHSSTALSPGKSAGASKIMLTAMMADLMEQMRTAAPVAITKTKEARVVSKNSSHSNRPQALKSCGLRLSFGHIAWTRPH